MKRKIITSIISAVMATAMITSSALAAAPAYNQDNTSVGFTGTSSYLTVLITQKDTNNIFYVGQNNSGYSGAQTFLIKNNPSDGTYVLKTGNAEGIVDNEEFSILTLYNVTATVDSHISNISLVDSNNKKYEGGISNGTATFSLPSGTYTVDAVTEEGYRIKTGSTTSVTIPLSEEASIKVDTEQIICTVTGSVDANVKSVTLTDINNASNTHNVTINSDLTITASVPVGTYKVEAEAKEGYLIKSCTESITLTNDSVTAEITVTSEQQKAPVYTVNGTINGHVQSVSIKQGETTVKEFTLFIDNKFTCELEKGTYSVSAVPENGYRLSQGSSDSVTVTETGGTINIITEQILYPVTVNIDANIDSVSLIAEDNTPITGTKNENTVTFSVPAGTYTVEAVPKDDYRLTSTPAPITVNETNTSAVISLSSEKIPPKTYDVSCTVDDNIASLVIKKDGNIVKTIENFPEKTFICKLEAGDYTVEATAKTEYTITENSTTSITVTTDGAVINITAEPILYTVTGTADSGVKSVSLIAESGKVYTETVNDSSISFSVPAGTYTISAAPNDGYKITTQTQSVTVDKDNPTAQIAVTSEEQTEPTYEVSGTIDEHVESLIIRKDNEIIRTITEFTGNVFSCKLEAGDYTIEVTPQDGYELLGITGISADGNFTITNEAITGINITTQKQAPKEPLTKTELSADGSKLILTSTLSNYTGTRKLMAAAYDGAGKLLALRVSDTREGNAQFEFDNDAEIKSFKILVWSSLEDMKPLTNAEKVEKN